MSIKTPFVLSTLSALTLSAVAAPWRIEWSHLTASPGVEPNSVLLGKASKKIITTGTTFGRVTDPAGDPPDVFEAVLNPKGEQLSVEQFGGAGGQYLRGAVRSCWGNETLVLTDFTKQQSEVLSRSSNGNVRWRLPFPKDTGPSTGIERDFWGNHWIATRSNTQVYSVSKISRSGTLVWSREATGPEKSGAPRILRRDRSGNLIMGVPVGGSKSGKVAVACYDDAMKHQWSTMLGNQYGVSRDVTFDGSGRIFTSVVYYDDPVADWHTKLWMLSAKGEVLGCTHVKGQYFSGWRLATDKRGHVYMAGMEYGESGRPIIIEFDPSLNEVSRFALPGYSSVFIHSLQVSPDGKDITMAGSAYYSWLDKPTQGAADAFVVRCHRNDTIPITLTDTYKPPIKRPGRATEEQYPW